MGKINKPVIFSIHGCLFNKFDDHNDAISEELLKQKNTGAVASVASTRSHEDINFPFLDSAYYSGNNKIGAALYEFKYYKAKELLGIKETGNLLMFNLLGDPSMEIYKKEIDIEIPEFHSKDKEIKSNITNLVGRKVTIDVKRLFFNEYSSLLKVDLDPYEKKEVIIPVKHILNNYNFEFSTFPYILVFSNENSDIISKTELYQGNFIINCPDENIETEKGKKVKMPIKIIGNGNLNYEILKEITVNSDESEIEFFMPDSIEWFDNEKYKKSDDYTFPLIRIILENGTSSCGRSISKNN
ncbi:MAG: C25 family cysteine peptidase [Candidatus Woesearchaeota archaeon]